MLCLDVSVRRIPREMESDETQYIFIHTVSVFYIAPGALSRGVMCWIYFAAASVPRRGQRVHEISSAKLVVLVCDLARKCALLDVCK